MIPFHIIVAIDPQNGIGKDGKLPWHLSGDLKHFREITCATRSQKKKNAVVMGRKTWDSLPSAFRPLSERVNIVLTRNHYLRLPEGVLKADSFEKVLEMSGNERLKNVIETIFVIGGRQIFEEAMKYPQCQKIYLTQVLTVSDCDTFFPDFQELFEEQSRSVQHNEGPISYYFAEFHRKGGVYADTI